MSWICTYSPCTWKALLGLGPVEVERMAAHMGQWLLELPLVSGKTVADITPWAGVVAPPTQITPCFCGRTLWQVGFYAANFKPAMLHALGVTRTAIRNFRNADLSKQSE